MEPQAESISDMKSYMSIKEIYESLEVEMPEEVKYCPYIGSYEDMISEAYENNNKKVLKALIEYKNAMIDRSIKIKELFSHQPEQLSQVSGATVN